MQFANVKVYLTEALGSASCTYHSASLHETFTPVTAYATHSQS